MRQTRTLTIYVEGGGGNRKLLRECQRAFSLFFERAGLPSRRFTVEACGSRKDAYDDFCTALGNGENALLLVDSEELVACDKRTEQPVPAWQHLADRPNDKWPRPVGATDEQAQLMVPTMEAWFLADKINLAAYYAGRQKREAFNESALPKREDVEAVRKEDLETILANATRPNQGKGLYHKGRHSFGILAALDPAAVARGSYHARRLLCHLKEALKAAASMTWLDCTEFVSSDAAVTI